MSSLSESPVFYAAYSLVIASDIEIPGLARCEPSREPDVRLWAAGRPDWLDRVRRGNREQWHINLSPDEELLTAGRSPWLIDGRYLQSVSNDGVEFIIDIAGGDIWTWWPSHFTVDDMATYFTGSVLGALLAIRGIPVLHASAVLIDGAAVAFLGHGGAGKSTTCAALSLRGYPVLTEDVLALDFEGDRFMVRPGYPVVRLWPDSADYLRPNDNALQFITPGWKKGLDVGTEDRPFHNTAAPLASMYLLSGRTSDPGAPWIDPVARADAVVELVANAYATPRNEAGMRARQFRILSQLSALVPTRRVTASNDPGKLAALCDLIVADHREVRLSTSTD